MAVESNTNQVEELLAKNLADIGIPPRPEILDVLAREMRRPEPDFNLIAKSVSKDVSLAAGLIKTANSPFFGLRVRARTVVHALTMLGVEVAAKALAGIALRNAFPVSASMERFWDASAKVAEYSGYLAMTLGQSQGVRADDAYTYGLFRDCGMPVLMRKFPRYREVLAQANADAQRRFTQVEDEGLPTNHAIVGCMLAQNWSLPEEICLAIRHHHDHLLLQTHAQTLPPSSRRLIALTQLAEFFHQGESGLNQTQEWRKLGSACMALLNLEEEALPALAVELTALRQNQN